MMENFKLKVFRVVAATLNFRRAAEELHLTQPAVKNGRAKWRAADPNGEVAARSKGSARKSAGKNTHSKAYDSKGKRKIWPGAVSR